MEICVDREPTGWEINIRSQRIADDAFADEQKIYVTNVRPHLGGKRYWLLCPCGTKVGRLYLPFGAQIFRCWHCYNLTYTSSQTHNQCKSRRDREFMAALVARETERLRRLLDRDFA